MVARVRLKPQLTELTDAELQRLAKVCLIEALEQLGSDGRGRKKLTGYLMRLGLRKPEIIGALLREMFKPAAPAPQLTSNTLIAPNWSATEEIERRIVALAARNRATEHLDQLNSGATRTEPAMSARDQLSDRLAQIAKPDHSNLIIDQAGNQLDPVPIGAREVN